MHPRLETKAAMRRHLNEGGSLHATDLETVFVPAARIRKASDDETVKDLRVWELREVLRRALVREPAAALDLVADLLGLRDVGLVLARAPRADAPGAVVIELAEAGAAVGAVQAAGLEALADGRLDPGEAQVVERLARAAERELVQVTELARAAQAPQLELAAVAGGRR